MTGYAASAGELSAFGYNNVGQSTPPTGSNYTAIAVGVQVNLALKDDGSIVGWGSDTNGQATPPAGMDFAAIAAGRWHSIALKNDGSIVAWGRDHLGQATPPAGNDFVAIAADESHNLALRSDGSIVGWGNNFYGQIDVPAGNNFTAVSTGVFHGVALTTQGTIVAWTTDLNSIAAGLLDTPTGGGFVAISAGTYHSLALRDDGTIVGWGANTNGQLDIPAGSDFIAVSAGNLHSLALKSDGSIVGWGQNGYGESTPPAGVGYTAIAAGWDHSLAIGPGPPAPPSIITHPMTQNLTAGGKLTLTVSAGGPGPFTYQWFKDGVAIVGATGREYILHSAQTFHAGDYAVTVTNPYGSITSNLAVFSVTAPAPNHARLLNLSTRALALTGSNVLIPGFVIQGTENKRLLIRAVGPQLAVTFGLSEVLPDPRMVLKRWNGASYDDVDANDDWGDNANAAAIIETSASLYAFDLNSGSLDAVLLVDLPAGQYTVVADDGNGDTGVAIVEVYDADDATVDARLINISNRGFVGTGDNVMIPGFVVSSEGPKTLLIRVVGPRLAELFSLSGTMVDPQLELYGRPFGGTDALLLTNDDWGDNPEAANTEAVAAEVYAFGLTAGSADAAVVVTVNPGIYTVVGSAAPGDPVGTGVVLVEVYVVP